MRNHIKENIIQQVTKYIDLVTPAVADLNDATDIAHQLLSNDLIACVAEVDEDIAELLEAVRSHAGEAFNAHEAIFDVSDIEDGIDKIKTKELVKNG